MDTVGPKITTPGPEAAARPARLITNLKRLLGNWGPVVLLTLGSLWLIQGALAKTGSHGVIVQGADYDAGIVKPGAIITHSFRLINLSAQPVMVDAQAGCGCTVVTAPSKPLAPLHSELVKSQVDTEFLKRGAQSKSVLLFMQSKGSDWQQLTTISFHIR